MCHWKTIIWIWEAVQMCQTIISALCTAPVWCCTVQGRHALGTLLQRYLTLSWVSFRDSQLSDPFKSQLEQVQVENPHFYAQINSYHHTKKENQDNLISLPTLVLIKTILNGESSTLGSNYNSRLIVHSAPLLCAKCPTIEILSLAMKHLISTDTGLPASFCLLPDECLKCSSRRQNSR